MTEISLLPDGSTPTGTEEIPGVQSGTTKRFQMDDVAARADTRSTLGCELTHSAAQSIADVTWTALSLDTETQDDGGYHAPGANTRITIPTGKTGKYTVAAGATFAINATGVRLLRIMKNGGTQLQVTSLNAIAGSVFSYLAIAWTGRLAAGEYIEVEVYQGSGGNLNVNSGSQVFNATLVRLTA